MEPAQYPVQFSIDYPDRPLNRLTTAFRIFWIIPIAIVLGTVSGGVWQSSYGHSSTTTTFAAGTGGLLLAGPLLMILFRRKYPPVVVRLEPGAAAVRQPGRRLSRADG
jgi:hypothetical protein